MSGTIIQLNEGVIKQELKELVRSSAEETLSELLEQEASTLLKAERHERTSEREEYRAGHYDHNLTTTSGNVKLKMPKLKGVAFETGIIERYRRRESSVEEQLWRCLSPAYRSVVSKTSPKRSGEHAYRPGPSAS